MKKAAMTGKDIVMLVLLVALLSGVSWYMFFYQPLQSELALIKNQSAQTDNEISAANVKVASMQRMEQELEEIRTLPADEVSEIAPYDNAKVVMSELHGILGSSLEYKLNFADPDIQSNGTVRRNVSMTFTCADYASAKAIIRNLTRSHWRCLVGSLSLNGTDDISSGEVTVTATITFFESTKIS